MKRITCLTILLAVLLVAVGGLQATATCKGRQEIVWAYARDIKNIDPAFIPGSPNYQVALNIFNGLVRYKPHEIDIEPSVATSWDISEDGRVYTFHLRDDVYFHKGYGQLTSADVKFSIERIMDPAVGSKYYGAYRNVEEVVAVDDFTVELRLFEPEPGLLVSALAYRPGYIVCKAAVEEMGDAYGTNPIGSGPYYFDSWKPGEEVVLLANEEYWNGAPYYKKVTLKVIPEESIAVMALLADEVNYLMIRDPLSYEMLENNPSITMPLVPGTGLYPLWMNTSREPLDDIRVRQAIAYAIDQDAMATAIGGSLGQATDSFLAPPLLGYTADVTTYPYDPDRARQLLTDAGYVDNRPLELVCRSEGVKVQIATILQSYLADVGITVEVIILEEGAYEERRSKGTVDLNIESISRFEPNQQLTEFLHSNAFPPGHNISYYSAADALIEAQSVETDPVERIRIIGEIQKQVSQDVPVYMLFVMSEVSAWRSYIKGGASNTATWMPRFELMYEEE